MKEKINIQKSKKSNPKMTYFSVLINDEIVRDFLPTREMAMACAQYVSRTQNIDIIDDFTEIDCPNCADQASIDDELHFSEMRKFFDEYIQEMILKPHMPFCSRCGADSPDYVLLLRTSDGSPLNFAACTNCRDELTLKQNAACAAQERIGA